MAADVLVTGSAGFLGSALARRLQDRCVPCDLKIGCPASVYCAPERLAGIKVIVNCAAVQLFTPGFNLYDYSSFHETNVVLLRQLAKAAQEVGVRKFIHISSDMAYGLPQGRPFRETDELRPVGLYGRSKKEGEAVLHEVAGIPVLTIFRPRVIGGPGRGGLFQLLGKLARKGLPLPLFGRGHNLYQMIHVDDFAALILEAIDEDRPGTFNAGNTAVTSLRQKVQVAARCCGRIRPLLVPIPNFVVKAGCRCLYACRLGPLHPEQFLTAASDFTLDLSRALTSFRWRPTFTDDDVIEDSFRQTDPVADTCAREAEFDRAATSN
jgi:dTDP-glucose 4,6-dehydratase